MRKLLFLLPLVAGCGLHIVTFDPADARKINEQMRATHRDYVSLTQPINVSYTATIKELDATIDENHAKLGVLLGD